MGSSKAASAPAQRTPGSNPFFLRIGSVMLRAKQQRLEPDDLLLMYPSDDVETMSTLLKASWEREVARAAAEKAAFKPGDKKKPTPASMARAVWPLIFPLWRVAVSFFAVSVALAFAGPLLLTFAIRLISDVTMCAVNEEAAQLTAASNGTMLSGDEMRSLLDRRPTISEACRESNALYMGYVYAGIMLLSKMIEGTCQAWHSHLMTRVALRARSGLISMIYRKCLWLSGLGGSDVTIGKVQNLMANDAQFFLQFAPLMNNLFAAPVQIIVAFVWLSFLIGPVHVAHIVPSHAPGGQAWKPPDSLPAPSKLPPSTSSQPSPFSPAQAHAMPSNAFGRSLSSPASA